jgi:hypothetical protein
MIFKPNVLDLSEGNSKMLLTILYIIDVIIILTCVYYFKNKNIIRRRYNGDPIEMMSFDENNLKKTLIS